MLKCARIYNRCLNIYVVVVTFNTDRAVDVVTNVVAKSVSAVRLNRSFKRTI